MQFSKWKAQSFSDKIFDVINYTLLIIFVIVCFYPLYYIVMVSFSNEVTGVYLWPNGFTLEGYRLIFRDDDIWMGYRNTIFYTIGGVVFSLFLTVPCAYALSRKDLPGKNIFTIYLLITMFVSGGLVPTYLTVQSLHLLNTWIVVIILTGVSAYNIIVARTFFKTTIPDELLEAARMDGCGDGRFFVKIALPLSKPIIAVLALWIGVGRWNSYFTEMVYLRDKNKFTLSLYLRRVLGELQYLRELVSGTLGEIGADNLQDIMEQIRITNIMQYVIIVIASAPMLAIYPFIQKYFAKGVMIGSVKG